jgi:phosphatidylinositol glycan class C protein
MLSIADISTLLQISGSKIVKSSILVFLVLMALSPVLRTLSAATSSDSIWALTAVLFILNVLLADYTPAQRMHGQERSALKFH